MERLDLLGAVTTQAIYVLCISVFVARLVGRPDVEHWFGAVLFLTAIPLACLLVSAPHFDRPALYYLQISLMLVYLLVELLLDYVFKLEFRQVRWMVISYVTIFFAGTGGMIGVAGKAGGSWAVSSIVLFLVMAGMAFVQRAKTGL